MAATKKIDTYQMVTDRFLAEMEKGNIPWRKPWIRPTVTRSGIKISIDPTDCAYSRSTGKAYSLLNQMLLLRPGEWATHKQIADAGGRVKKGEKASIVVFWKFIDHKTGDRDPKTGDEIVKQIPMLRYFNVFHVETQTEGVAPKAHPHIEAETTTADLPDLTWNPVEEAEEIASHYLTTQGIDHRPIAGDRAFYSPVLDYIQTPKREQFSDPAEYYSTLFHEMTHSTGHSSRLNRFNDEGSHAFGSENYSREELVAEIGAACLCNFVGVESKGSFRNSTAYLQSWMKALKDDPKAIVTASSKAEKAVELILA